MYQAKDNDILRDLRQDTMTQVAVIAGLTAWLSLLLSGLFMPITPISAVPLWLVFEGVCGAAIWFKRYSLRLSIYVFLAGMGVCNTLVVIVFSAPVLLYLSLTIPIVASILLRHREALAVTTMLSLAMLIIANTNPLFRGSLQPLLLLWWLLLFVGFVAFDSLYRALQMVLEYQSYAISQMHEARDHRAQLMQLTQALQEAQQHLEKSNVQLRHISRAAEEARRLKAEFAANVSHELRTPINLIVGFAEMIMAGSRSYSEALPSAYWRDINTIYRNARHLQGLINDVLDISQIEVGRMAVVKEDTSPREVILEAAALMRDSIAHKGLRFEVEIPEDLPNAWIDRLRIRQVILNLLGNALRFTDSGRISIRAFVQTDSLYLCISDTGIGIPPDELNRVFEEFHQVEGSLSRSRGGSGLGLTLSKQFIELHGGRVWIESDGILGKGSQFWFTLPLQASPAITAQTPFPKALPFASDERYFVVLDEDPAITQLFERHTLKHHAISAQTTAIANDLISKILPSALVIDQQTDIDDLAQNLPIIRCTMPSSQRYMQALGVASYLAKPVTPETLTNLLNSFPKPIRQILVVDDDQDMVRLYGHMLQQLPGDFQMRKAYSGIEALEIMRHAPPDVVILDLLMGDMNGDAVIAAMKADPVLIGIPIILTSAFDISDVVTRLTRGQVTVDKPTGFQPAELVRCVEALVDALIPSSAPASIENRSAPAVS